MTGPELIGLCVLVAVVLAAIDVPPKWLYYAALAFIVALTLKVFT